MAWNDNLTSEQGSLCSHIGSHARLLAGPGTGKTLCLTRRILYLLSEHDVPASGILSLTFTRAAAAELRRRISIAQSNTSELPTISTLHSFALRTILRYSSGLMLPSPIRVADDYEERWIILEDIKRLMGLSHINDAAELVQRLSADWEQLRVEEGNYRFPDPRFRGIWDEHRRIFGYTLRAELVYQLKHALEEGQIPTNLGYQYLLVDEYQDLNPCDLAVIKLLATNSVELFVAGDDDQSIYGFRYANPDGIRQFAIQYVGAQSLALEECRRCDRNILELAHDVIRQDLRREGKTIRPASNAEEGEVHILSFPSQHEEATNIAQMSVWLVSQHNIQPENILILLRNDRNGIFSRPIIEAIESMDLRVSRAVDPFSPLDSVEGRHFLSMLRLIHNSQDHLSWRALLELRNNNIGSGSLNNIQEMCHQRGFSFVQALQEIKNNPSQFRRGTIIRADIVEIENIISGAIERQNGVELLPFIRLLAEDDIEDEETRTQVINLFETVIEETGVENMEQLLRVLNVSVMGAEQEIERGSINIMTMHQAKGLSADAVFIAAAEDEYIPGRAEGTQVDDERRLLYVSLTRARHFLYITHCQNRIGQQKHSGSRSGDSRRTLTRFLRGGPLTSRSGNNYVTNL